MSFIYARSAWLRASLKGLMRKRGRRLRIEVADSPKHDLPANWRTWEPWLAAEPVPFLHKLIIASEEIFGVVRNLKGLRDDLGDLPATLLKSNYNTYFNSWLKYPWLVRMSQGKNADTQTSDENTPGSHVQGWILVTEPAPLAHWSELVAMSRRILIARERTMGELDRFFESSSEGPETLSSPQKKRAGAPPLTERHPDWKRAILEIIAKKDNMTKVKDIVRHMNETYPHLGKHTVGTVRGQYNKYKNKTDELEG